MRRRWPSCMKPRSWRRSGQLTGGVAHDFNNLLTPITGALDILQKRYGDIDERSARLLSNALQAADRAKTLLQRLLGFARRQSLRTEPGRYRGIAVGHARSDHEFGRADRRDAPPRRSRTAVGAGRSKPARAGDPQPYGQRARRHAAGRTADHPGRGDRDRPPILAEAQTRPLHQALGDRRRLRNGQPRRSAGPSSHSIQPRSSGAGPGSACRWSMAWPPSSAAALR